MKPKLVTIACALALGLLAGCDRKPEERTTAAPPSQPTQTYNAGAGGTTPQANTPTTPANAGTPSAADKEQGSNPVQQQVDPKQAEQQKDFQPRGAGPEPKPGS